MLRPFHGAWAMLLLLAVAVPLQGEEKLLVRKTLSVDLELDAAQAAIRSCAAHGIAVHVYVSDAQGNIRLLLIGPGAHWETVSGARRKVYTAAITGRPTLELQQHPELRPDDDPAMLFLGGGLPIRAAGEVVGALAVGGGKPEEDAQCAQDGVHAIDAALH